MAFMMTKKIQHPYGFLCVYRIRCPSDCHHFYEMTPIHLRGLFHNHLLFLKENKKASTKLTSKEATLLDYSEEGRALQSQQSSVPLEGFATHTVDALSLIHI